MAKHKKVRILIIDDDLAFRLSLEKTLKKAGYSVRSIGRRSDVEQLLSGNAYPMIMMDMQMSSKAGIELLSKIRKLAPQTKVIVMSVDEAVDELVNTLDLEDLAFLHKPVKKQQILACADLALNRKPNGNGARL